MNRSMLARTTRLNLLLVAAAILLPLATLGCGQSAGVCEDRGALWIDLTDGEPILQPELIADLATAKICFLGEKHGIAWHHDMQRQIVADLIAADVPVAVGMEQLEACYQPVIDEYNAGKITFDELAERTDWAKRWSGFEDYRAIVETAHKAGCPILGLNAKKETIHAVAMQGLDGLSPDVRAELPDEIQLDDPAYRQKLNRTLMVHAHAMPGMLDRMFAAQVCRDETMAANIVRFLQSPEGKDRHVVVTCGSFHTAHGLGTAARVRRQMPEAEQRILVMSGSGDVELSERMQKMARDITITHAQKAETPLRLADYLFTAPPRVEGE